MMKSRRQRLSGLAALSMSASLLIAATGCGGSGDDEANPAAPPAAPTTNAATPYDGTYAVRLTPAAARKIPDPSFTAGTYRLVLGDGKYEIYGDRGPYGGGRLVASSGRLRFGPNNDAGGCQTPASYTATRSGATLRLRAVEDACEGQRGLLARSWRRR